MRIFLKKKILKRQKFWIKAHLKFWWVLQTSSSTEGNLYPAVAMDETVYLPPLSYQAYLHPPGIGKKCSPEDFFILLFSDYEWGWAFFPSFKTHPYFHFCEVYSHPSFICLLGCWICCYWVMGSLYYWEMSPLSETWIEKIFLTFQVVFLPCWLYFCQIFILFCLPFQI